jgi:hypothetical protein
MLEKYSVLKVNKEQGIIVVDHNYKIKEKMGCMETVYMGILY